MAIYLALMGFQAEDTLELTVENFDTFEAFEAVEIVDIVSVSFLTFLFGF